MEIQFDDNKDENIAAPALQPENTTEKLDMSEQATNIEENQPTVSLEQPQPQPQPQPYQQPPQHTQSQQQYGFNSQQSPHSQPAYVLPPAVPDGKGMAIASIIIGACGLLGALTSAWTIILGFGTILTGIVGLVLAIVAKSKWKQYYGGVYGAKGNGLNITGISLNIATIAISVLAIIVSCVIVGSAMSNPELYNSNVNSNIQNTNTHRVTPKDIA